MCLNQQHTASALHAQDIKARVEEGEGVPFFDERFSCRQVPENSALIYSYDS